MDNENKIKHLEFIQQTITRMATNSFLLKGWTVTLIVGVLAFANVKDMNSNYVAIAIIPTIMFWILDGFFIRQERLFREVYNSVRLLTESEIDYSMDTTPYNGNVKSWFKTVFSKTLNLFYLPILVVIVGLVWILPKIV